MNSSKEHVLELRFLVPLHLVGLARRAMAPFANGELPPVVVGDWSRDDPVQHPLTDQELDILLRG